MKDIMFIIMEEGEFLTSRGKHSSRLADAKFYKKICDAARVKNKLCDADPVPGYIRRHVIPVTLSIGGEV